MTGAQRNTACLRLYALVHDLERGRDDERALAEIRRVADDLLYHVAHQQLVALADKRKTV